MTIGVVGCAPWGAHGVVSGLEASLAGAVMPTPEVFFSPPGADEVEAVASVCFLRRRARRVAEAVDDGPGASSAAAVASAVDRGVIADLPDEVVVSVAAGAQRLATWALSRAVLATRELAERWAGAPLGGEGESELAELGRRAAVEEIALASGLSAYGVDQRLEVATAGPERTPLAWEAFRAGRLEWAKLAEIVGAVGCLTVQVARAVDAAVLEAALTGNLPQLRALLRLVIARLDPEGAEQRAREGAARRQVRVRDNGDGVATLALTAAADAVATADATLTALAASCGDSSEDGEEARDGLSTKADVLLDLIAAAGRSAFGVPDAAAPNENSDTDEKSTDDTDEETIAATSESCSCRAGRGHGVRTEIVVTVPLSTALGLSRAPGHLRGLGPIPGELSARIAAEVAATVRDGHWRCAIVEDRPGHRAGTLLGLGRTTFTPRYTPPGGLRRFVTTRDGTCRFPGCRRSAHAAGMDLDHRLPWRPDHAGGATCDCTLQTLCRAHHRLKHRSGFRVARSPEGTDSEDGVLTWTTPTGRAYSTAPAPLPVDVVDEFDDPPPF